MPATLSGGHRPLEAHKWLAMRFPSKFPHYTGNRVSRKGSFARHHALEGNPSQILCSLRCFCSRPCCICCSLGKRCDLTQWTHTHTHTHTHYGRLISHPEEAQFIVPLLGSPWVFVGTVNGRISATLKAPTLTFSTLMGLAITECIWL